MKEKTKHILVLSLIAITTLPFFFIVMFPTNVGTDTLAIKSTAQYISSCFGYIGLSFLVWQLILGTRAISGLFFNDLASKLKLHRFLGTYGVLLIFLHPVLILVSYAEKLGYILLPSFKNEFEQHVTYGRVAFIGLLIIWVTSALIRGKIAYRPWKYIHYISYPVLILSLLHVPEIGSSHHYAPAKFFWLLFVSITALCFLLRARHLVGYGKITTELISKTQLTNDIWLYRLRPYGKHIDVQTGQYVYIQIGLLGEEHPFTVVDTDKKTGEILVSIKVFGRFSQKMSRLDIGSDVLVDGPYGVFTNEINSGNSLPPVYLAGGIGITPFVKHVLSRPKESQIMIYANQTKASAAFRNELKAYLGENFVDVFSKETGISSQGIEYGFLSAEIVMKYVKEPLAHDYYICGPPIMMKSAKTILLSLGVPTKQIHSEEFSF